MTVIDPFRDIGKGSSVGARSEDRGQALLHHDVRDVLQGLIGGIGQVDPAMLDVGARIQFERISASARMLARLLGAMLDGDADPFVEESGAPLDVGRFLDHVRRRHAGAALERGLRLEVDVEPGAPAELRLDFMTLARIVDNLVGNAIKFAEAGTVRLSVAGEPEGRVAFRVVNDGHGLTPSALDAPAGSIRSGHGLGLQVVMALTERLGGEVELGNRTAGGVEAVLRFPAEIAVGAAPASLPTFDLLGVRVLLAEDNPTNQMVASQMLRSLKAEVTVAGDGVEALERFDRQAIDLVVVDIEMPRLSGLDVIRAIRARGDARAQVPIVALTAYAMREHRERIAAAGANGLISKPITSVEALGRSLAAHVGAAPRAAGGAARGLESLGSGPVIDAVVFDALCEAIGSDTMAELLDKVVADLQAAQRELVGALATMDRAAIRSASHILVSVAGAVGAVRLQACARALNAGAATEPEETVLPEVRRCAVEIDAAIAFARERRAVV